MLTTAPGKVAASAVVFASLHISPQHPVRWLQVLWRSCDRRHQQLGTCKLRKGLQVPEPGDRVASAVTAPAASPQGCWRRGLELQASHWAAVSSCFVAPSRKHHNGLAVCCVLHTDR